MATEQSAAGRLELLDEWVAFQSVTYLNPKDLFNSLKATRRRPTQSSSERGIRASSDRARLVANPALKLATCLPAH